MPAQRKERAPRVRRRLRLTFAAAGAPWVTGFTSNVSTSGLAVTSMATSPPGTLVALECRLPAGTFVRAVAQVMWTVDAERRLGQPGQMGLRFLQTDPGFLAALGLGEFSLRPEPVVVDVGRKGGT